MKDEHSENEKMAFSLHTFIDAHIRELRWTSYTLAAVASFVVLRKIRAGSKFTNLAKVPKDFIEKNYTLQGRLKHITDTGDLKVEHIPIIESKWLSMKRYLEPKDNFLCLRLAGISVSEEGVTWLKKTVNIDSHVWFKILQASEDSLDCDVRIKKGYLFKRSLNKDLVREGVCAVHHFDHMPNSSTYNTFLFQLVALEHKAAKKGRGIWEDKSPPGGWLGRRIGNAASWIKDGFINLFRKNRNS